MILAAAAQHGTSAPEISTAASSTASPSATLTPQAGHVPLFPCEEEQWSQASLDELRAPQRRLFAFDKAMSTDDVENRSLLEYAGGHEGKPSLPGPPRNEGSGPNGLPPPSSPPPPGPYHGETQAKCKVHPGDAAWPKPGEWEQLNQTLGGALIKGVPAASLCYFNGTSRHDEAACTKLAGNWTNSYTHLDDPIEMFSPVYQGLTCQPTSWYDSGNCTQGGYPTYTVNVSTTAQLQVAVNFARNTGVRFVIKNTGHDFSGKSGGAGSLSVWVHNLKDIAYIPSYGNATTGYDGPASRSMRSMQLPATTG